MSHDVFISYRRDGGEHLAGRVKDALKSRGFSVFMDVDDLKSGKFDAALYREIEKAANVIIILTPGCLERCKNEDDWLRQEIRHAIKCKRNIIPIFARGFEMPSPETLPSDIAELVGFHGPTPAPEMFEESIDKLVSKFLKSTGQAFVRRNLFWILPVLALGLGSGLFLVGLHRQPKDETVHEAVSQKLREALDSHGIRVDCTTCTAQDPHVNVRVDDGKVTLTGALKTPDVAFLRGVPLKAVGVKSVEYEMAAAPEPNVPPPAAQPSGTMRTTRMAGAGTGPNRSVAPGTFLAPSNQLTENELRAREFVATGQEQLRNGNYVSAENRFQAALNLDPNNASAKSGLARAAKAKSEAGN